MKTEAATMPVASYPKQYDGRDSFLRFCNDKIRFTFQERDQISRRNFGLSYRKFCIKKKMQMASVVDFIAHLSHVGIKAKRLEHRTHSIYVLCGLEWHQRSTRGQDNMSRTPQERATHREVKHLHSGNGIMGNPIKKDPRENDKKLFIKFCKSVPRTLCDKDSSPTRSHFENCFREFCSNRIVVEASSEEIKNHIGPESVDINGVNGKSDSHENGRNGFLEVDSKCKPLRENNRCKNKNEDSSASPENALQAISKSFRCKTVYAEKASKLQSQAKKVRKRPLRCLKSPKRVDKCLSEMDNFSLNVEMSKYLHMTKRPQRFVSGVLLRDIKKYPLYQLKLWLNDDGSERVLKLPFFEGIESFRQFAIENIILTGKMHNLILCDDFLKEYHEFCVDRKLLQASDVSINQNLGVIGINPHVKVLKPGKPRYAYSGLTWRHSKHYEKYEKIKVKVILHDRISVC